MGTDTKAPVLEGLKDGESYTVEDTIDGNPGAYTFTVSDLAALGETSSGVKSVTINGEPQDGPIYRLSAPDGGNNDAGAEHTVVATDNAGKYHHGNREDLPATPREGRQPGRQRNGFRIS